MGKAEIVMIHEDVRGRIFRVTVDEREFYVLETRRGYARGRSLAYRRLLHSGFGGEARV